jgi:hypothetical protein
MIQSNVVLNDGGEIYFSKFGDTGRHIVARCLNGNVLVSRIEALKGGFEKFQYFDENLTVSQ